MVHPWGTMGRRLACEDSVMFCWETLCPGINLDVTSYLPTLLDHVHPLMTTV